MVDLLRSICIQLDAIAVRACSHVPWIKEAASGIQILALPLITHGCSISTQVSQVRIEGTERRKGTAKKEMKKNVSSLSKRKKVLFFSLSVSKPFALHFHLC